jgi:hypothetical protein
MTDEGEIVEVLATVEDFLVAQTTDELGDRDGRRHTFD